MTWIVWEEIWVEWRGGGEREDWKIFEDDDSAQGEKSLKLMTLACGNVSTSTSVMTPFSKPLMPDYCSDYRSDRKIFCLHQPVHASIHLGKLD